MVRAGRKSYYISSIKGYQSLERKVKGKVSCLRRFRQFVEGAIKVNSCRWDSLALNRQGAKVIAVPADGAIINL